MQVPDQIALLPQKKTTKYPKFVADDDSDPDQTCPTDLTDTQSQNQNEAKQQTQQSKNVNADEKDIKNQKKGKKSKKKKPNSMQANNKQQKKEKFHCRFYMQGTCKNGNTCKFIHPVEAPSIMGEAKKSKQAKQEPYAKSKSKQESSKMIDQKDEQQIQSKHPRDVYYQKMIDTMKQFCYSCKTRQLLVVLSCGCNTICENCVNSKMACSKENHLYDNKVYIK